MNLISKSNTGVITTTNITDNVLTGFSFVEKLDDSLDIGQLVVRGLTSSTPYTMFDTIQCLYNSTEVFSLRVAGDSVSLISKRPKLYEHTLTLIEHTKILELFKISGKTFTQPTDGTIRYYLYDVLEDLRLTTPFETASNLNTTRLFEMPVGDLKSLLETTTSPEFTFKEITFREALTQVCGYIDGIPRLVRESDGTLRLHLDFTNELQDLISSTDDFISESKTQDIEFYATQIESNALNLVSDTLLEESVEVYPSNNNFVTARSDTFIFDFLKSYIPTPKPIYNISKLETRVNVRVSTNSSTGDPIVIYINGYYDVDITDRLLEFQNYKTQPTDIANNMLSGVYAQSNTIYYKYGEKNITHNATVGIFDTDVVIEKLITIRIFEQLEEAGSLPIGYISTSLVYDFLDSDNPDSFMYRTSYVPIPKETRINIDRQDITDVNKNSMIISNQQSRVVNLENFTNNIQGKINRIGNSELSLSNRVSTPLSTSIYNISDYTEDIYIITQKEQIFFKDYVDVKYGLSRNYNMISRFIAVNSEIRQWEIGEFNTLNRNLIYKEYVEIDVVDSGDGSNTSQLFQTEGRTAFIETFKPSSLYSPVRLGVATGSSFLDDVLVSFSSNGGGNSLLFNWKFEDNINAGNYKEEINSQVAINYVPYANSLGISTNLSLYFADELAIPSTDAEYVTRANEFPITDVSLISNTYLKNNTVFELYKDSREVIGGTIHQQIISKRPDGVILGRWLSLRNRLVSENPPTVIRLYVYSNGIKYNRTDTFGIKAGFDAMVIPTLIINPTSNKITVSSGSLSSSNSSWALTDENDKILLAVNQDGTLLDTITFDFNNKRSGVNYKY